MLTSLGRVAGRRVLFARAPSKLPRPHASLSRAVLLRTALPCAVRTFTVSRWLRLPAADSAKRSSPGRPKATATKKKAKSKPKKAVKKKAAKPKKKPTTEEQQAAEKRLLQKVALLRRPTNLPSNAYLVYVKEQFVRGGEPFGEQVKTITSNYKYLSSSEMERLASTAQTNSDKNKETTGLWVKSHPPEAIYAANIARGRLRRKYERPVRKIHDERLLPGARSGYNYFIQERLPEIAGDSAAARLRSAAQEWKRMSEVDKSTYKQRAAADSKRATEQTQELKEKAREYLKSQGMAGLKL